MKIISFKAENLFSLGETSIDLENRGLVLITGYSEDEGSSNGSGKSSLANKGLVWTLYGATANGIRADQVANKHREGTTRGIVEFIGLDGSRYKVTRTRNPSSLKLESPSVDLTKRHEKDTQKLLTHLLGKELNTFLFTDLFGQGVQTNFLSLTPRAQLDILESILPMEELTEKYNKAKENLSRLQSDISLISSELNGLEGRKTQLRIQLKDLQASFSQWEQERKDQLENLYAQRDAPLNKEELDKLETQLQEINVSLLNYDNLEADLSTLKQNRTDLHSSISSTKATITQLKAQCIEVKDKTCPTCNQVIDIETTNKLAIQQNYLEDQIRVHETTLENLLERDEILETTYKDAVVRLQEKLALDQQKKILEASYSELSLKNQFQKESLAQEISRVESDESPYKALIAEGEVRLQEIEDRSSQLTTERLTKENKTEHYKFWAVAFNQDLKNYMVAKSLQYLENKSKIYLSNLNNSQIKIHFSPTKELKNKEVREGLTISVSSQTGGDTFDSLSGGEQQLANFAVGLALCDLAETRSSSSSNLLILDEPFVFLSARNCENVVRFLADDISSRKATILLISNEDEVTRLVPSRIHVQKKNGVSTIL